MSPLFKKLNYKDQAAIVVLNAPEELWHDFQQTATNAVLKNDLSSIEEISFALVFVTQESEIVDFVNKSSSSLSNDTTLWMCYPKKSSKKYKSGINRDSGWEAMGQLGMEPVRQVAIDEDWSALRFRFVDNIKSLTRRKSMTLTDKAKNRTTGK